MTNFWSSMGLISMQTASRVLQCKPSMLSSVSRKDEKGHMDMDRV